MILKIDDRIRTREVKFFNNFQLDLKYDSVGSSFKLDYYFNPNNLELKEMACLGHYHLCTLEHNGELLLSGQILSEAFAGDSTDRMVAMGGYALPGVLEDCEIPTGSYPLQNDGLSLKQIAEKLIRPFGLKMVVHNSVAAKMNSVFDTSTAKESQTVKSYLTELATQKNIIISHTEKGELLFTSADTSKKPILDFDTTKGTIPGTEFSLSFNGQAMHSHITVQKEADAEGGNEGEYTIRNPYVFPKDVYRPRVISQSSGTDVDTEQAARNALAAELKNIKLTVSMDRWEANKKIIKPNNTITVLNPDVYLYNKSTWFIEEVSLTGNEKGETAVLTCVLPEVYNGQYPDYLFKGINLH